jgi:hypothetical protein
MSSAPDGAIAPAAEPLLEALDKYWSTPPLRRPWRRYALSAVLLFFIALGLFVLNRDSRIESAALLTALIVMYVVNEANEFYFQRRRLKLLEQRFHAARQDKSLHGLLLTNPTLRRHADDAAIGVDSTLRPPRRAELDAFVQQFPDLAPAQGDPAAILAQFTRLRQTFVLGH